MQKYPYDLEKAKALLKDAGYPGGFELTFLVPESGSGMQSPVEMATVIQANLATVGVKAKIQTLEWGAYLKKYLEAPDMAEMSWNPSIGDPDHMMYMLLSSDRFPPAFNAGYYQNDKVDDLLRKGRTTVDEKARVPLYREAQKVIVEDAPWIFVDHGKQVIIYRKRVQGFKLPPEFRSRAHAGVAAVGGGGLQGYVLGRLLLAVPVLFGVSLLVFAVMHLAPGDPAAIMLGAQATREDVDAPAPRAGARSPLAGAVRAVAGPRGAGRPRPLHSPRARSPARGPHALPRNADPHGRRAPGRARHRRAGRYRVGHPPVLVARSAQHGHRGHRREPARVLDGHHADHHVLAHAALAALGRDVLALRRRLRRPAVASVLPAITLGTASAAALARMTRSSVLEIVRQDFVRSARAKGLAERAVVGRHVLKNAVNPVVTVLGIQVGTLLGGAILTETVFSWPGLGSMMVRAIQARDYPLVQGGVLLIATTFVGVNLLVDLLYAVFDPRIRYE